VLQSEEYFVREEIWNLKDFSGLSKFGRQIRSMEFDGNLSGAQGRSVVQHCHNLTHVSFTDQPPSTMWDIVAVNPTIESLKLLFPFPLKNLCSRLLAPSGLSLPNLKTLVASGSNFRHEHIIAALRMCNRVVILNLSETNINSSTIRELPRLCPHLRSLGLAGTPLCDADFTHLSPTCPQILHLDIEGRVDGNGLITDAGILEIVLNMKGLQSLNISYLEALTDASLVHIYTHSASTLQTLYLDCYAEENGEGNLYGAGALHELFVRCNRLCVLHLEYFHDDPTFDTGLVLPESALRNLTELILRGNIVSEQNITAIGIYATKLQILGIYRSSSYTHTALMSLYKGCPALKELYIDLITPGIADNINAQELNKFVINLWKEQKPGLIVSGILPIDLVYCNVLHMR